MVELVPTGDRAVERAAALLGSGAVVAIPTDTVYGLAVDPTVVGATDALFAVKRRPPDVPLPMLVGDRDHAALLGDVSGASARALIDRYWPGPLTVVVRALSPSLAASLGGAGETIGIRCPAHDFVRALCTRTGPLAVTSANLHRQSTPESAPGIAVVFGDDVPLVVDGGVCKGAPSTVVDCSAVGGGAGVVVLREGAIAAADVLRVARQS